MSLQAKEWKCRWTAMNQGGKCDGCGDWCKGGIPYINKSSPIGAKHGFRSPGIDWSPQNELNRNRLGLEMQSAHGNRVCVLWVLMGSCCACG